MPKERINPSKGFDMKLVIRHFNFGVVNDGNSFIILSKDAEFGAQYFVTYDDLTMIVSFVVWHVGCFFGEEKSNF